MKRNISIVLSTIILILLNPICVLLSEPLYEVVLRIPKLRNVAIITIVNTVSGEVQRYVTDLPTVKLSIKMGRYIVLVYSPTDKLLGIKNIHINRPSEILIDMASIDTYKGEVVYKVNIAGSPIIVMVREIKPYEEYTRYIRAEGEYILVKASKTSIIVIRTLPKGITKVLYPMTKAPMKSVERAIVMEYGKYGPEISVYKPVSLIEELPKLLPLLVISITIASIFYFIARKKLR